MLTRKLQGIRAYKIGDLVAHATAMKSCGTSRSGSSHRRAIHRVLHSSGTRRWSAPVFCITSRTSKVARVQVTKIGKEVFLPQGTKISHLSFVYDARTDVLFLAPQKSQRVLYMSGTSSKPIHRPNPAYTCGKGYPCAIHYVRRNGNSPHRQPSQRAQLLNKQRRIPNCYTKIWRREVGSAVEVNAHANRHRSAPKDDYSASFAEVGDSWILFGAWERTNFYLSSSSRKFRSCAKCASLLVNTTKVLTRWWSGNVRSWRSRACVYVKGFSKQVSIHY